MKKILKGWEILKEIEEGSIKEGTKFEMQPNGTIWEYMNKTLIGDKYEEMYLSEAIGCDFKILNIIL